MKNTNMSSEDLTSHVKSALLILFIFLSSLANAKSMEMKSYESEPNDAIFKNASTLNFFQQTKVVKGTVKDENGQPLVGVNITVKNKSLGTTTDTAGNFSINIQSNQETLVFTLIGYATKELLARGGTTLSITMTEQENSLSSIVVIGYGTALKRDITGAITKVSGKTVSETPAVNIANALQGRVAGLQVTSNGSPGASPIVRIRGISSISFASDPLYVVDGFPTGDLSAIDTRDIESVDVLKDAAAAAIYGSRATNGVIMITTKRGHSGERIGVSLDSYVGFQAVTKRLDLLDNEGIKKYALAYRGNLPGRLLPPEVDKPIYAGATQTYGQTNTDWQDAYFRKGMITQHNIALNGGNDVSHFYTSAGYMDQRGTSPAVGYKRYNFRLNSEHNIGRRFTFGQNLYTAFTNQQYDNNETGSRTNLVNVIRNFPFMPVYDPTSIGGYRGVNSVLDGGDPTNPVEDAELKNPGTRSGTKILGNAYLEVKLLESLKFRSTFGVDYANQLDYRFSPIFNNNGTIAGSNAIVATITNNRSISSVLLYTQQLTFDKYFGQHHINATAVVEQQNQKIRTENGSGQQPSNDLKTLNNASNIALQTLYGENFLFSALGRINYNFGSKYLFSAAIRRDGLSVWAPGKKWATFPSASIGWRIDQEEFMKSQKFISELKVRAGYGITGLNGTVLGNTPWLVSVNANSSLYPFGNNANAGSGSSIQRLGNTDLEWEKTKQLNIGLDLGILKNDLTLSVDYFKRKTDNLILNVPLPPSVGYLNSNVLQNVGAMDNSGLEMQLGYIQRTGAFKWNASVNVSIITNKVTRMATGVANIEAGGDADFGAENITRTEVGQAIQSFYGYVTEGLFQNAADVASHAKQRDGTAPGDIKFADLNQDGVIDSQDRTFLGSFLPKFSYGINLGASYKNFDLSLFFQGVQGNKIFNASRVITEGMVRFFNAGTQVLNAWTPTNTNTNIPRAASGDPNQNSRPSDRFIEDGSFLRLKNIILAYNLPQSALPAFVKNTVRNIRLYVSSQNLFTITKYTGYDPEVGNRTPGSSLTNGIDFAVYPQPKSFQFGLQANF